MKSKCNLFGLLSRGVTTTHPLCSVFILSLLFVFCTFSVSVRASSSNIPELSNWQFQQALDAYVGLTPDQQEIANFLSGSQGYAFAGIANSNLQSSFSSYDDTINSVKSYGAKMWEQILGFGSDVADNMIAKTNDLSNFLGSVVTYAKSRSESFSAWLGNVGIDYNSSSEFRIHFGKDQAKNNIDFYGENGLYQWQRSSIAYTPQMFDFIYQTKTMSSSVQTQYNNYLAQMVNPIRFNDRTVITSPNSGHAYNIMVSSDFFSVYHNIFANTYNNSVYFCDDNGNPAPSTYSCKVLDYWFSGFNEFYNFTLRIKSLSYSNYNTVSALFNAIYADPSILLVCDGTSFYPALCDFVINLYIGDSWSNKQIWSDIYDLNLTSTSQYTTVNSPTNVIYLDINGFIKDLYDNPTIIYNYVIDNSIDNNGDPVDSDDFNPISKFITIPSSGISIGSDFFKLPSGLSLFDTYIADLWNNTKGLVSYCADIFSIFTPDEGTGLAYIVYGGIAVGVIGGIFSKFLL